MSDIADTSSLAAAARAIWEAGVEAVDSFKLVADQISLDETTLKIAHRRFDLDRFGKLIVVGAGKAGAGMTRGLESRLTEDFLTNHVRGWVNVPADCVPDSESRRESTITLHAARPAGRNEPYPEGVHGTEQILKLVGQAGPNDLILVLISGGGSALLPAPVDGITLDDKLAITRALSRAGAPINDLNFVRTHLSKVKGGGLLRACRSAQVMSLSISDVIGDPLETIASGPTVPMPRDPAKALEILSHHLGDQIPENVVEYLSSSTSSSPTENIATAENLIVGSNQIALAACQRLAEQLGFDVVSFGSEIQGEASEWGRRIVRQLFHERARIQQPVCYLYGGETTVSMNAGIEPGKGGRNQELALAAAQALRKSPELAEHCAIVAGGTDGEDGPTDAAGAIASLDLLNRIEVLGLSIDDALRRHDSYPLLDQCGALLKTGPTHTNVMDLTVAVMNPF